MINMFFLSQTVIIFEFMNDFIVDVTAGSHHTN